MTSIQPDEIDLVRLRRRGYNEAALALGDDACNRLMMEACRSMVEAALAARRSLLAEGFLPEHPLCKQLDEAARDYEDRFIVQRRYVDVSQTTETISDGAP